MSLTAPSTPEYLPRAAHATSRRSFTVPPKLSESTRPRSAESPDAGGKVETLFACASAKVVAFSAAASARGDGRSPGSRADRDAALKGSVGTLAWTSATESTIVAGW